MKKLVSLILTLVLLFTLGLPVFAANPPALDWGNYEPWHGYKEVALTVDNTEDYSTVYALGDKGFDYIEAIDASDGTSVDVIFHIRSDMEEEYLKSLGFPYTVIVDASGTQPSMARTPGRAATETGPESGLRFEVKDGWIVGLPIGDGTAATQNLLPADASVYPDVIFDYEGLGVTFDETYGFPNRLGYRTVTEYYSEMSYLAEKYPHLVKIHNVGYSWYGRPMWVLEICNRPGVEDGRAEWMHLAATHAREWPANELALNNAWWFVTEYDKYLNGDTNVEPRVIEVMENVRSWITPLHNPDGTHWDQTTVTPASNQRSQRKNRRPADVANFGQTYFGADETALAAGSTGAANYIGTDLNRNWLYRWGSNDGSSVWNQAGESTNRGMGPGSEPETVALTSFTRGRMIGAEVSGHTSGDLIIYPWSNKKGAAEPTGNLDFVAMARELSSYNVYTDYHERVIYSQAGEGQEYMYGAYRVLGITLEMGQSFKPDYLGVPAGYATAAYNDRNPNVGARQIPINYAASTMPTTAISAPMAFLLPPAIYAEDGSLIEPAQTTYVSTYTHSGWRTRTSYLRDELIKDPDFVKGKILIAYNADNSTGNTQHEIAMLAQGNGAKGVIFCQIASGIAQNSAHTFLGAPSINSATQIANFGRVKIPVGGTFRMMARELLEYTRDGQDWDGNPVENKLTLQPDTTRAYNPFSWYWEKNAYLYVTLAENAREYAGHIQGTVTGKMSGTGIEGANLNLTKDVYSVQLAENIDDVVFWDPATHTFGSEGPARQDNRNSDGVLLNPEKPNWDGVDWSLYAPWNAENAHADPALTSHYEDIAAWFEENPPQSHYYDKLVPYTTAHNDVIQTIVEQQTGYTEIQDDSGSFDWSVVPSQQFDRYTYEGRNQPTWPDDGGQASRENLGRGSNSASTSDRQYGGFEVDSPDDPRIGDYLFTDEGYAIVAKAPGYYHSDVQTVFIEDYKVVKDGVNFALQEAIVTDFDFDPDQDIGQDIVVEFNAYGQDGAVYTGDVIVRLNGQNVEVTNNGDGSYSVTINLEAAGIPTVAHASLELSINEEMSPLVIGDGLSMASPDTLTLTASPSAVKAGESFDLTMGFRNEVMSNAATITFTYDSDVFTVHEDGFIPAEGVTVLTSEATDGKVTLTVGLMGGYGITDFGHLKLTAKADAEFSGSLKIFSGSAEYVLNTVPKTIATGTAFTTVKTNGSAPVPGTFTLIDLSNIIDMFGKNNADPNWYLVYSAWDFNNNLYIDIQDVSFVARNIV